MTARDARDSEQNRDSEQSCRLNMLVVQSQVEHELPTSCQLPEPGKAGRNTSPWLDRNPVLVLAVPLPGWATG